MPKKKKRLQCGVSETLDASRWLKLTKGVDDFRFGAPGPYAGRFYPASPAIIHESSEIESITPDYSASYASLTPPHLKELTSTLSATSKISLSVTTADRSTKSQTPTKKVHTRLKQKKHIQSIEQKLKENPLILFPYLESDIPHEVFEKLMSILGSTPETAASIESITSVISNTDVKLSEDKLKLMQSRKLFSRKNMPKKPDARGTTSTQAIEEAARHIAKGGDTTEKLPRLFNEEFKKNGEKGIESTASVARNRRLASLDPYRAFLKRINYSSERTKKKAKKPEIKLPEESETNVRQVAEDFCNWMQTIGGEDAKFTMDVDKVLTLFAMNAELESLQTTSNVLDEFPLTQEEADTTKKPRQSFAAKRSTKPILVSSVSKIDAQVAKEVKPIFVHYRYGAWYLDINQWKKLKPGEVLEDPEEILAREKQEAIRCSDVLDTQLGELHTYKAFTSFIRRNNLKVPNFLQYVATPSISSENVYGRGWSVGKDKLS